MISLIFVIIVTLTIISAVKYYKSNKESMAWWISFLTSVVVGALLLAVMICGCVNILLEKQTDRKIVMYTEENTKIEQQVTQTVEKYLEHELNIYESLQGEDIQTLLVVYPEINSNELVKRQIEVFIENNNKIKELKESKLAIPTWKFVIYFGG